MLLCPPDTCLWGVSSWEETPRGVCWAKETPRGVSYLQQKPRAFNKHPNTGLGSPGRETNEEGRLGAATISVVSMQGDWESACRETNEGRQMKKGDFGNQHAGRQMKGDNWRGRDFGNQHAGRQRKGGKWRGGDFGNQHAGRQMKGDKWRRETRSGSDFGNQHAGKQMKKGD